MKLKLGLLMVTLVMAQAYAVQPGTTRPFAGTSLTPEQQKAVLLEAAGQKAQIPAKTTNLPAGTITAEQQKFINAIKDNISKIAESMDKDVIPVLENAVKNRSFGFFETATLGGKLVLTIGPAIYGAIDAIIDLDRTNPQAKTVIKHNLEDFFKAAKYDSVVARLTGLLGKLPGGTIKDLLVKYAPKLNEIPRLIASQL